MNDDYYFVYVKLMLMLVTSLEKELETLQLKLKMLSKPFLWVEYRYLSFRKNETTTKIHEYDVD